jgi:hypothetical protein
MKFGKGNTAHATKIRFLYKEAHLKCKVKKQRESLQDGRVSCAVDTGTLLKKIRLDAK